MSNPPSQPQMTHHQQAGSKTVEVRSLNLPFYHSNKFEFDAFLRTGKKGNPLPVYKWEFDVNLKMSTGTKPQGQRHYDYDHEKQEYFKIDVAEIGHMIHFLERPDPNKDVEFNHKPEGANVLKKLVMKFEPPSDKGASFTLAYMVFENQKQDMARKRYIKLNVGEARLLREYLLVCAAKKFENYHEKN